MKRKHKKVVGFLGLIAVAAMTVVAALLPTPNTQATTAVTDTITVRVVDNTPEIIMISPVEGSEFTYPNQEISFDYSDSNTVTATLYYTDNAGEEYTYVLTGLNPDFYPGSETLDTDLAFYGYGDFTLTVKGEGLDGVYDEQVTHFSYIPVKTTATEDQNHDVKVDLDYNPENTDVQKIVIEVRDENGNPIEGLDPTTVYPPATDTTINFSDADLPEGTYVITVTTYDGEGNIVYRTYELRFDYEGPEEIPLPDTGGLFAGIDISKTDYLITGIVIFSMIAIAGIMMLTNKREKNTAKATRTAKVAKSTKKRR